MRYAVVRVPSTFPVERRLVYYWPVAALSHKTQADNIPKIKAAIAHLFETFPNEKVLVHTVSYHMTEQLASIPSHYESICYLDRRGKDQALSRFKAAQAPVALFAPSLERGIDLPGDLCTMQIIVKVPFPSLGDKQIATRLYATGAAGQAWYATETIRTLVQMTGRGMRSADDHCITFILDAQFSTLRQRNRNLFPAWWSDAVRSYTPTDNRNNRKEKTNAMGN